MDKLIIRELTFDAAHYIPNHPKCAAIHGHTFFVRNLVIECDLFVDFAMVKDVFKQWDHVLIVPEADYEGWLKLVRVNSTYQLNLMTTQGAPTCENLSKAILKELLRIPGVLSAHFELYEGPNQGVPV